MQKSIRNNINLKARICGYLAGDGSVIIRKDNGNNLHHIIKFSPDHESLIKPFVQAFKILYKKILKSLSMLIIMDCLIIQKQQPKIY